MMDARRIVCSRGHLLVTLKTNPDSADQFADDFMSSQDGSCMYCGAELSAETATILEFEQWASREDRFPGNGAPRA